MAIALRTAGTWVAANATTQTVTLPTHQAGDMLLVRVAFKHATMPTTVTCGTAGWTKIGQYNNGTTVSGNGTGSVIVAVFYKEATSGAETNPVITYHASVAATPSAAVAMAYSKGASEAWVAPTGAGGPVGTTTAISSTISSHISVTAGDMVDFFYSQGDNNTLTVPSITQTGVTFGTVVESPATALSSATSNDIDADGGYRLASSGTSSAAAVITGTATAGDQGSSWQTRLRVQAVTTYSGSFTADAYIAKTTSGSFTANAYILKTVTSQSRTSVNDVFTGTDGLQLPNTTPQTALYGSWSTWPTYIDLELLSNRASQTSSSLHGNFIETGGSDGTFQATVFANTANDYPEFIARSDGSNRNVGIKYKRIGTSYYIYSDGSQIATGSVTISVDQTVKFVLSGTNLDLWINGAYVSSYTVASSTNTKMALIAEADASQGCLFDDVSSIVGGPNQFTVDAWIGAQAATTYNGSFTADSWVTRTFASTFTANSIISKTDIPGSFTANAWVSKTTSGSFTANAIIAKTLSGTFTADSIIRKTDIAWSVTANAIIRKTDIAGSLTANAYITRTFSGSFTADAAIVRAWPGSFTADAWVTKTTAGTFTANAMVQRIFSGSLTADAFVRRVDITQSITANAFVKREFTGSVTANAMVQRTFSGSFTADAWVEAASAVTYNGNFTADAWVKGTPSGSFTANAHIAASPSGTFTADAFIRKTTSGSFTANAWLSIVSSGSLTADAWVKRTFTGTLSADGWVKAVKAGSFTADAIITRGATGTFTADAWVKGTPVGSVVADAIIRRTDLTGSITANAYVQRTFSSSITANSWVKGVRTGSVSADAHIKSTVAGSFTANAWIASLGTVLGSFTADAIVRKTDIAGSVTANAYISRQFLSSFSVDAHIKRTFAGILTAEAWVKGVVAGSISADAFIQRTAAQFITADAYVQSTISGSVTADAWLAGTVLGAFTVNAVIYNPNAVKTVLSEVAILRTYGVRLSVDITLDSAASAAQSYDAAFSIEPSLNGEGSITRSLVGRTEKL